MSKNNQQAALPVNTHEQYSVVLNRDSFLKTSKKLHKHIKEQNKNKQEFNLSEIQEMLSKALGNRNWRELDEKFKNCVSTKDNNQPGDNVYLETAKEVKSSTKLLKTKMSFKNVLNALNSTEITKLLTIATENNNFSEPSRQLAHIISLILCQNNNAAKLDLAEITSLLSFDLIFKLYEDAVSDKLDTTVMVTNREHEEEDLLVVLDNETKRAIFKYVQKIPNFEYISKNENGNYSLPHESHIFYTQSYRNIIDSLNYLFLLNEDFVIFKIEWMAKEKKAYLENYKNLESNQYKLAEAEYDWINSSWLYALSPIAKKVKLQRIQINWKYQYNEGGDILLSDIFVLYAKNVIDDKNTLLKNNLTNILNNLQTYKDLSLNAQTQYE